MRERLTSAIALHRSGQLEQAEKVYAEVLQADPDNVDALHFLGVMRHQQGRSLQGLQLVSRAISLQPDCVDAVNNLGNIYLQLGASVEAAVAYEHALELRPDHPDALRNLGIARRKVKRHEEALELHERAVEDDAGKVENYYALATAYKQVARYEDMLATLKKALAVKPQAEGFRMLGALLYGMRRTEEAARQYEAWLRAEPDNPIPRHMLAACTLKEVPARAGDAFVAKVFDSFAETFDAVLMGRLEYRAPALVGEALKRIAGEPRGELDVVDGGCGTGLLAPYLRPYARRLVGVDLSPKMLEKARDRGYDGLVVAELASFLRSEREAFDIVASSDTLVYFGDLREVFAASRTALRPGGRLVFTLEHAIGEEHSAAGYGIQPHGRYAHTEAYVRSTLAEAGFELSDIEKVHLRRERGRYVDGLLVSARATNAALALALHRQGRLEHRQGRSLSALKLVSRALELGPGSSDSYSDLGDIYRSLGSAAGAVEAYKRALELQPDHPEAGRNLAAVLDKLRRVEESADEHRRALEREPGNADHLYALADAYGEMSRGEEALETLKKALAARRDPNAFRRLGATLYGVGRLDEAVATYEAWLRAEPDNPVARHLLAACTGKDVPERASDGFVARDFDRFAETFDEVLGGLEYSAPALVGKALERIEGAPRGELEIVDAGCGTGLLAPHLRPYARRLVGVDLSPKMLEKARKRALYDRTSTAELTSFLRSSPEAFDLVASSDTLNYFGDLREVLAAARASLRAGGRLLFTLEHAVREEDLPAGYRLHPAGRYVHAQSYVRSTLVEAGFEVIAIETAHLRREGDAYVDGLVVAARATSRAASG